LAVFVTAVVT